MEQKLLVEFSAVTAQGIGGASKYREIVAINPDSDEDIYNAKRAFAIKYGVMIDMIQVTRIAFKDSSFGR